MIVVIITQCEIKSLAYDCGDHYSMLDSLECIVVIITQVWSHSQPWPSKEGVRYVCSRHMNIVLVLPGGGEVEWIAIES